MNIQEFAELKGRAESAVNRNMNIRATVNELLNIIATLAGLVATQSEPEPEEAHANTGEAGDPVEEPVNEPVPEGEGDMSEDDTAVPDDADAADSTPADEPDGVA